MSVDVSQFPVFAAGCLLYLSSPNRTCQAALLGRWGDRTNDLIHKLAHTEVHDGHDHMDLKGLRVLIHQLHHHYQPLETEVSRNAVSCGEKAENVSKVEVTVPGRSGPMARLWNPPGEQLFLLKGRVSEAPSSGVECQRERLLSGLVLLLLALGPSRVLVLSRATRTPQGPAWPSEWQVQTGCRPLSLLQASLQAQGH